MDRVFLQETYHMSLGFTMCSLSLSRISKLVSGICPSKPKEASLLLTQSFPTNLKPRVSLSFHFVFWGFLQGAKTLGLKCSWSCTGHSFVFAAWGCPKARTKMLGHPLFSPQPGAPATLFCGDRIKSLLFLSSSCVLGYIFGKARGEGNILPSFIRGLSCRGAAEMTHAVCRSLRCPQCHWGCSPITSLLSPRWHRRREPLGHPSPTYSSALSPPWAIPWVPWSQLDTNLLETPI